MKKRVRRLTVLVVSLVIAPFLADLLSPFGQGKTGIAYAKDGGGGGDHVPRGAGRGMHNRPLVPHQSVDQAALAHVGRAGQDHAPRLDQVPARLGVGQQGFEPCTGRRGVAGRNPVPDRLDRTP